LYFLDFLCLPHPSIIATDWFSSFHLWRSRLGHLSVTYLKQLISSSVLGHDNLEDLLDCLSYLVSKSIALLLNCSTTYTKDAFDLVC